MKTSINPRKFITACADPLTSSRLIPRVPAAREAVRQYPILIALMVSVVLVGRAPADDVLPGIDLFETSGSAFYDSAVPAGFFGPGSDPFTGTIVFHGAPLPSLGSTDTIVRRVDPAMLPVVPSSDVIPIEIVALNLVSINPITVTYSGGMNPELWNVHITLSPGPQPQGTMTIGHQQPDGGIFDSSLPVLPRLIFTRISDSVQCIKDDPQDTLELNPFVSWSHTMPNGVLALGMPFNGHTQSNFWPGGTPGLPGAPVTVLHYDGARLDMSQRLSVPESGTIALLATGLILLATSARRRRRPE